MLGRGGGQVVSLLTFCSDYPSSNPAEAYSLKRTKINKKRPGLAHFLKNIVMYVFGLSTQIPPKPDYGLLIQLQHKSLSTNCRIPTWINGVDGKCVDTQTTARSIKRRWNFLCFVLDEIRASAISQTKSAFTMTWYIAAVNNKLPILSSMLHCDRLT